MGKDLRTLLVCVFGAVFRRTALCVTPHPCLLSSRSYGGAHPVSSHGLGGAHPVSSHGLRGAHPVSSRGLGGAHPESSRGSGGHTGPVLTSCPNPLCHGAAGAVPHFRRFPPSLPRGSQSFPQPLPSSRGGRGWTDGRTDGRGGRSQHSAKPCSRVRAGSEGTSPSVSADSTVNRTPLAAPALPAPPPPGQRAACFLFSFSFYLILGFCFVLFWGVGGRGSILEEKSVLDIGQRYAGPEGGCTLWVFGYNWGGRILQQPQCTWKSPPGE